MISQVRILPSLLIGATASLLLAACATMSASTPVARVTPPTDCRSWVGTDRNAELPGYLIAQPNGTTRCVPLLLTAAKPPPGYSGDFYVGSSPTRS